MVKYLLKIILVCTGFLIAPVFAQSDLNPIPKIADEWRFEVTPYLWALNLNSTLSYNDQYLKTATMNTNTLISNLKSGGMIASEVHYGSWGVMADVITATLQKTGSIPVAPQPGYNVSVGDKATLQNTIVTGAATYTLLKNDNTYLDALVGARWVGTTATINLTLTGYSPISDSKSMSTADPIVGFKGRYRIADSSWYIPFYADIGSGGGTTNVTWQAMLGIGKTIENWVDVSLIYRGLYYDMDSSKTNGQGLLQKTTFQGPQLSATFKF
jgi:hypothetical protein